MDGQNLQGILVGLVCLPLYCYGQYQVPNPTFEAFKPKGFRVSIPGKSGWQLKKALSSLKIIVCNR